uniref:Uncharacterized protein n=1 Tax=Rhizophora mucronata TaxID=61149 RepID=A0A2P2N7P7_RHIMU
MHDMTTGKNYLPLGIGSAFTFAFSFKDEML